MHTTIYRDDFVPACGRCEGDGVHFFGDGGGFSSGLPLGKPSGGWAQCPACSGTGVAQPPRRKWIDELAGTLGCLGFVAIFWAAMVMLP